MYKPDGDRGKRWEQAGTIRAGDLLAFVRQALQKDLQTAQIILVRA
jgi:hypothetical protein